MKSDIAIQDTYTDDFAVCYGCGKNNDAGLKLKTFSDGDVTRTSFTPSGVHRGAADFAYGGIVASVIDCHSTGSAALFWMAANDQQVGTHPTARFVTARLEVDYVAPTPMGEFDLVGEAAEIGTRKVIVTTELRVDGVVTARGRAVLVKVAAG